MITNFTPVLGVKLWERREMLKKQKGSDPEVLISGVNPHPGTSQGCFCEKKQELRSARSWWESAKMIQQNQESNFFPLSSGKKRMSGGKTLCTLTPAQIVIVIFVLPKAARHFRVPFQAEFLAVSSALTPFFLVL